MQFVWKPGIYWRNACFVGHDRFREKKEHDFEDIAKSTGVGHLYGKVEGIRRTRLFQMQKFYCRLLHGVPTSFAPGVVICGDFNSTPYSKMYQYLMHPSDQNEDLYKVGKINYNLPRMVSAYGTVMQSSLLTKEVTDLKKKLVDNEPPSTIAHIYRDRLATTLDYILFAGTIRLSAGLDWRKFCFWL